MTPRPAKKEGRRFGPNVNYLRIPARIKQKVKAVELGTGNTVFPTITDSDIRVTRKGNSRRRTLHLRPYRDIE